MDTMKKIANKRAMQKRTLALSRETIRHLTEDQLSRAAGGISVTFTTNCTVTCQSDCGPCPITRTDLCTSNGIACTSNCTLSAV